MQIKSIQGNIGKVYMYDDLFTQLQKDGLNWLMKHVTGKIGFLSIHTYRKLSIPVYNMSKLLKEQGMELLLRS